MGCWQKRKQTTPTLKELNTKRRSGRFS